MIPISNVTATTSSTDGWQVFPWFQISLQGSLALWGRYLHCCLVSLDRAGEVKKGKG